MPNHDRGRCLLLLRKSEELLPECASSVTIEVDKLRDEEAVEDGVQKKRVFGVLA